MPYYPGSYLHTATVTLTDAQIRGLPTAAHLLAVAPAAGTMIQLLGAVAVLRAGTSYGNIAATARMVITNTSGESADASIELSEAVANRLSSLLSGPDGVVFFPPNVSLWTDALPPTTYAALQPSNNTIDSVDTAGLYLYCTNAASGNFTDGDPANTLIVSTLYVVVDLTTGSFVAA